MSMEFIGVGIGIESLVLSSIAIPIPIPTPIIPNLLSSSEQAAMRGVP
jgi:hypothetical protein